MKKLPALLLVSTFTASIHAKGPHNVDPSDIRSGLELELESYAGNDVSYELSDGILTLKGKLPSLRTKEELIEATKAMPGIGSIIDLTDLEHSPVAGRDVPHEVISLLSHNAQIPPITVAPTFNEGILTLRGHVRSKAVRDNAIHLAKSIPGVTEVRSQIEVKPLAGDKNPFIQDDLRLAISRTASLEANSIDFSFTNHEIVFSGQTKSPDDVDQLVRLAKDAGAIIIDTTQVATKAPAEIAKADGSIEEALTLALLKHPEVTKDIKVSVDDGLATLKGILLPREIKAAVKTAANTPGVIGVKNHLVAPSVAKITETEGATTVSDPILATAIEEQFEHNPYADPSQISWEIDQGVVTLTGQVPDDTIAALIRKDAELSGAERVINKLDIHKSSEKSE